MCVNGGRCQLSVPTAGGNEYLSADGMARYHLDAAGNVVTEITDKKGKVEEQIVVTAANLTAFTYLTEATADEASLKAKVPLFVLESGAEIYQPQDASLKFTVGPDTAMNEKFMMKTTDSTTLAFVVGGEEKDELELEGIGEHTVNLKVKYSGDAKIIVGNAKGDVIGFFTFVSEPKKVLDQTTVKTLEEEIASCEHEYRDEVVAPTEQREGYTLHLCTKCGYSYRDTYTAKLPCSHIYAERLVAATCKAEGYTLCTCTKCGDVTRKDHTELGPHTFEDKIVSPTCAAEGYTLHTCRVCGFTVKDTITAKVAHQYEAKIVESTCTSEGYTLHTCKVCQANYKDNYTGVKAHTYTVTVIAPTYTTEGYTNHVCSVCGSSYGIIYLTKRNSLSAGNIAAERLFQCARRAHVLTGESPETARQWEGHSQGQGCPS